MDRIVIPAKLCIPGSARGKVVFSYDSFSFLGGVDFNNGVICDYRHANYNQNIKGNIFVFPFIKGSTVVGPIVMEMIRLGTAPAGIINIRTDPLLMTGPLLYKHFYNHTLPIVNVSEEDYKLLEGAEEIVISENNFIEVFRS